MRFLGGLLLTIVFFCSPVWAQKLVLPAVSKGYACQVTTTGAQFIKLKKGSTDSGKVIKKAATKAWTTTRKNLLQVPPALRTKKQKRDIKAIKTRLSEFKACEKRAPLSQNPGDYCEPRVLSFTMEAVEGQPLEVSFPLTPCGTAARFEITASPAAGTLTVNPSGATVYKAGWGASADSFSYRGCRTSDNFCGEPASVTVHVSRAEAFKGSAEALSPYRAAISDEEKEWLVEKLGLNQRMLLEGTEGFSLEQFVDQRLLAEDWIAPDLRDSLLRVRDRNGSFATPNIDFHDEFITLVDSPRPPMGHPTRYILPSDNLDTPQAVRDAFDRILYTATRETHGSCSGSPDPMSFYEYYWSNSMLSSYLLMRGRYYSPLHTLMTHLWLGHFGVNSNNLTGEREHYLGHYVKIVEREALGSFKKMMIGDSEDGCGDWRTDAGLICDAMTNTFLDNQTNTKNSPNQNFARELMELFTLTPTDPRSGLPNYTDPADLNAVTGFVSGFEEVWQGSFSFLRYNPARHQTNSASAFGHLAALYPELPISNQSLTPKAFINHVLDNHPGTSLFLARKLFSMLVYTEPSDAIVEELAADLRASDYDIKALVRKIAMSEAMFSSRARSGNCVEDPFYFYSRVINGLSVPLLNHGSNCDFSEVQKWQVSRKTTSAMGNAGEVVAGWPTVFSHDFCGRGPGKDGAEEWQMSSRLLGRVSGFIDWIGYVGARISNDFKFGTLAQRAINEASAQGIGFGQPAQLTPRQLISFVAHLLGIKPSEQEIVLLEHYLTHDMTGGGSFYDITFQPQDTSQMERKVVGLVTLMISLPSFSVR